MERQGRAYAGNCDPESQGLARDPAQAVRHQKEKLKDPLSVMGVPSERGSCCSWFVLPPAKSGSIGQYLAVFDQCQTKNPRSYEFSTQLRGYSLVRGRGLERQENDGLTFVFDVLLRILTSLCTCSKSPGGCAFAGLPGVVCAPSLVCIT